jgi:hypothetical protein
MIVRTVERVGDVKIFGAGELGGKGAGLVKINECSIPKAHKLRTRILTTVFYDGFRASGERFGRQDLNTMASILGELGQIPISVRSSATNEAVVSGGGVGSVHAGENTSFMLPNNHPEFSVRFQQLIRAIETIYRDFVSIQPPGSKEKMAIVINPIPGIHENTLAGPVYFPLVSGVANSFFFHALKTQNPSEGFARIAFGHGYATVLDDFPVISMATIRNPLPLSLLGKGQKYFYAIDMTKNEELKGEELETMSKLNIRFAGSPQTKMVGYANQAVTFENLVQENHYHFRSDLLENMDIIASKISAHFQIEFVFNVNPEMSPNERGVFHIVQLTRLPELEFEEIHIPSRVPRTYLSTTNLQGHGVKRDITSAVVVSPFMYKKDQHDEVTREISQLNQRKKQASEKYILIVPGRLGSTNRNWGIFVDYKDVDGAVAIFEYGVDVAGRAEPVEDEAPQTGGIYGSHFLYMIQGGFDEEQKRIQTRMYGTQGTHFLTNLVGNNVIYSYLAPGKDAIDPWFFSPPATDNAVYELTFPQPVTVYADSVNQLCVLIAHHG